MTLPKTRYARSGELRIAYQVVGNGSADLPDPASPPVRPRGRVSDRPNSAELTRMTPDDGLSSETTSIETVETETTITTTEATTTTTSTTGICRCELKIVPFEHCQRPIDELVKPCTGTSECGGYIRSTPPDVISHPPKPSDDPPVETGTDSLWVLFVLRKGDDRPGATLSVKMDVFLKPPKNCPGGPVPVPKMTGLDVPQRVVGGADPPLLKPSVYVCPSDNKYVAEILLKNLIPDLGGWKWDELDASVRNRVKDSHDLFTFCSLHEQLLLIRLTLYCGDEAISSDEIDADVFDLSQIGSLYQMISQILVAADARAQGINLQYHTWYPVLRIGARKARIYMRLVQRDFKLQRKNFGDPCWLMRVGKYLEFLTCIGIIEAANKTTAAGKASYSDLLSKEQRDCYENGCQFKEIRDAIDVQQWQGMMPMKKSKTYTKNIGKGQNLLAKASTTLSFLELHHKDLRKAILMAGSNFECGCRTWRRVFRAAEEAIDAELENAYPEANIALEHDDIWIKAIGSNQYMESMNAVAKDARDLVIDKDEPLMDFKGDCIHESDRLLTPSGSFKKDIQAKDTQENACEN